MFVEKNVLVYRPEESGAPLSIHHTPVSVTFGFVPSAANDGTEMAVLDPSLAEADVLSGMLSVAVNAHGELCSVQKIGGCAIGPDVLLRCIQLASIRGQETIKVIRDAVELSHQQRGVPPRRNLIAYLYAK